MDDGDESVVIMIASSPLSTRREGNFNFKLSTLRYEAINLAYQRRDDIWFVLLSFGYEEVQCLADDLREKQRRTPHKSKESFEENVTFKRTYHYEYQK